MDKPVLRVRFRELLAQKESRENVRYSVSEIGRQLGMTRAAVYPWLNGDVSGVKFDNLEAICEFLECRPGDLLDYTPLDGGRMNEPLVHA